MAAVLAKEIQRGRRGRDPRRGPGRRPGDARDARRDRGDRRRGAGRERRADHRRALLRRHARLHGRPRRARGRQGRPDRALADGDQVTIDVDARRSTWRCPTRRSPTRLAAYAPAPRADDTRRRGDPEVRQARRQRRRGRRHAAERYSARKSRSSALNAAGRSSIAMWPVSSKITLREPGISSAKTSASRTLISRSRVAPDDQRRAGDLRQALAHVVVDDRLRAPGGSRACRRRAAARRRAARAGGWGGATTTASVASRRRGRRATVSDLRGDPGRARGHDPLAAAQRRHRARRCAGRRRSRCRPRRRARGARRAAGRRSPARRR